MIRRSGGAPARPIALVRGFNAMKKFAFFGIMAVFLSGLIFVSGAQAGNTASIDVAAAAPGSAKTPVSGKTSPSIWTRTLPPSTPTSRNSLTPNFAPSTAITVSQEAACRSPSSLTAPSVPVSTASTTLRSSARSAARNPRPFPLWALSPTRKSLRGRRFLQGRMPQGTVHPGGRHSEQAYFQLQERHLAIAGFPPLPNGQPARS